MKTHFEHLQDIIPNLKNLNILDLGSGRGSFLVDCAKNRARAVGLELNTDYIKIANDRAKAAGVQISVLEGVGENLPYNAENFDFVNLCEVIEHVNDPKKVLKETNRVLKPGGKVYMSVPNRFGMKDQHFGLYLVNWMPRSWSSAFISLFGKHKNYEGKTGFQRLSEMHYYTYRQAKKLSVMLGFSVEDIRLIKIGRRFPPPIYFPVIWAYKIIRIFYFDSFHLLLTKI